MARPQDDPFDFKSNSSSEDECFQAWSANETVVANLNTTPYKPVVQTVKKSRPDDFKERKCYLSPKEKGHGKMTFMERMKERNSKQPRVITELGSSSKSKHKVTTKEDRENPFENLKCSSDMRRFILSEFQREKVACNFLPEKQVAMAVIHRYKSYIASSKYEGVSPSSKNITKDKQFLKIGGKKSRTKKIGKKAASVGDSGFLDDSDNEKLDIEEFDENNLPIPAVGSFTLNPSPAQIKFHKQVLVRYNSDNDTDDISDCSPAEVPENLKKKQEVMLRTVKMCSPALPCLASTSLDQPGETSVDWETYEASQHVEVAQDVVHEVCGGAACGWCLKSPRPAVLQLCSACSSVAYCGAGCQGESWPTHKKICKKLKEAAWDDKIKLVHEMIEMAKTRGQKRKQKAQSSNDNDAAPQTSKRSRRSVQFNSQPEFEPSQGKAVFEKEAIKMETNNPKSILRKGPVKLQTVLYSPPVKSLVQHLATVKEGTQEERFKVIKSQAVGSGSGLKRQSSEKLRNKLSEMKNVKLNLNEKLDDSRINTDQISLEVGPRVSSPSKSVLKSTPVSSPTLVEEIKTLSSSRSHTSRVFSRRHELTPYPRSVDLESDQELSLTPTESENAEVSTRLDFNIPRRLDFDAQDDENDQEIEHSSQLLEEYCKISDDGGFSKQLSSASQDMFNSPDTNGNSDDSVAYNSKNVPASAIPDTESENEESSSEGDNTVVDGHLVELSFPVESSNANESGKFAVMIPESSSESSLAELSSLDTGLVGQSQGDIEDEDGLAGMFSENEENEVNDESEQEEDLLAVI